MPAGSPIDQWWKSHLPPKAPRPDTAQEVHCPECGQRLGSSSDAGAARRLVSWHRDHCTAALDIFATQESADLVQGDANPRHSPAGET